MPFGDNYFVYLAKTFLREVLICVFYQRRHKTLSHLLKDFQDIQRKDPDPIEETSFGAQPA